MAVACRFTMEIFIDGSGPFAIPRKAFGPSFSCAGALALPSDGIEETFNEFRQISAGWPTENGEVKGRLLDEDQMAAALDFMASRNATFVAVGIDLALHLEQEVLDHKDAQVQRLTANVTPQHQASLVREVEELQAALRALSIPDYVEMVVLTTLMEDFMSVVPLFVAQRRPLELGKFAWTIDAKAEQRTRMERLWGTLLTPFLESRSVKRPMIQLVEADYSAFERFMGESDAPPRRLKPHTSWKPGSKYQFVDIRAVMRDRSFANSRDVVGLQMVDVTTSATRRALQGNIGKAGWRGLGKVMVRPERSLRVLARHGEHGRTPNVDGRPDHRQVRRRFVLAAPSFGLLPLRPLGMFLGAVSVTPGCSVTRSATVTRSTPAIRLKSPTVALRTPRSKPLM